VQDEQARLSAMRDRVGTALIVAGLHEQNLVVELRDDRNDLPHTRPANRRLEWNRIERSDPEYEGECWDIESALQRTNHSVTAKQYSPIFVDRGAPIDSIIYPDRRTRQGWRDRDCDGFAQQGSRIPQIENRARPLGRPRIGPVLIGLALETRSLAPGQQVGMPMMAYTIE
jgi:hypothetical protein